MEILTHILSDDIQLSNIGDGDTYLGYGVYAANDPAREQIILKVSREDRVHFVALTADELSALNRFAKRCFASTSTGEPK